MTIIPLKLRESNAFVTEYHRHNKAVVGARFSIGLEHDGKLVGCAIVGRPVARMLDTDRTAEVVRLCTNADAPKGSCSKLYAACWKAWRAMGGTKLVTYTLATESGASLRGAGWSTVATVAGAQWSRPSRVREAQAIFSQPKLRWEASV